jgi:hypothetical protein
MPFDCGSAEHEEGCIWRSTITRVFSFFVLSASIFGMILTVPESRAHFMMGLCTALGNLVVPVWVYVIMMGVAPIIADTDAAAPAAAV